MVVCDQFKMEGHHLAQDVTLVEELCAKKDIIVPAVKALEQFSLSDHVPSIQFSPLCIDMSLSSFFNPIAYVDSKGFSANFSAEIDLTARIETSLEVGQDFLSMLYTFRSVSRAIPEVVSRKIYI